MKLESLVIADQNAAVNTFPGLVHTARHTMRAGKARKRLPNPQGRAAPKAGPVIGVKSKQGIPSRTRGWITSFLRRRKKSQAQRPGQTLTEMIGSVKQPMVIPSGFLGAILGTRRGGARILEN